MDEMKITKPHKINACLRDILYQLALKKPTLQERYDLIKRYESRLAIDEDMFPQECTEAAISHFRAKIESYLNRPKG